MMNDRALCEEYDFILTELLIWMSGIYAYSSMILQYLEREGELDMVDKLMKAEEERLALYQPLRQHRDALKACNEAIDQEQIRADYEVAFIFTNSHYKLLVQAADKINPDHFAQDEPVHKLLGERGGIKRIYRSLPPKIPF